MASVGELPIFAQWLGSDADRAGFATRVDAAYGAPPTHRFATATDAALREFDRLMRLPVVTADTASSAGATPPVWIRRRAGPELASFFLEDPTAPHPTTMGVAEIEGFTPAQMYAVV